VHVQRSGGTGWDQTSVAVRRSVDTASLLAPFQAAEKYTLRRFSSAKNFFGFTLRAFTKRSSHQQFYLDARELKSA
jgi:hypothetical protein